MEHAPRASAPEKPEERDPMNEIFAAPPSASARDSRPPARSPEDPFSPRALVRLMRRSLWSIFGVAALFVLVAGWHAFTATPTYRAQAAVVLDTREEQVVDLQNVMSGLSGDSSVVNTEVEVLRSRNLMDRVVARLDLEKDPEFNPDLREKPLYRRAVNWARAAIYGALGREEARGEEDPDFRRRQTAIDRLLERLSVANIPLTYVFTIRVTSEDAQKSADIANAIADLYILDQLDAKFEATRQATTWLSERVAELQVELEAAEEKVKEFSASTSLVSEAALEAASRQVKDLRERRAEQAARAEARAAAAARLAALAEADGLDAAARAEAVRLAEDRRMEAIAADLSALEAAGQGQGQRAKTLAARFSALLAARAEAARAEAERLAAQAGSLAASIAEAEARIEAQSEDLVTLRQLTREAEANRLLYEYFLGRMKETSVQQGIQQADSRVLSPAIAPIDPASPRKTLIIALAGVLGLMAGAGLAVARESFDTRLRGPEELEAATGLKVMGVIPDAPSRRRGAVLRYLVERPSSALAEAVRNLRTSILLSDLDRPPQVIMVTSSAPGEGKTTTALMLAQNSAALGKRVLVMECDLRRRVFKSYFDVKGEAGILSVLGGETPFEEAVHHDAASGLDVLVGQKSRANAADVFSSERFAELLAELRGRYDFIIIDTPPVLAVPDARVIASRADAILYAVRWNATGREAVRAGLDLFAQAGQRITGLALTQANPRGLARYGYAGYGYGYGYGARAARKYYAD